MRSCVNNVLIPIGGVRIYTRSNNNNKKHDHTSKSSSTQSLLIYILMNMEKVEVVVIGAGVIGLAVARSLSLNLGKEVLVVERSRTFGNETSSRNSEVIHGGLYYSTDSLKARTCVKGRQLLYEYCRERNIYCNAIGKLVIATEPDQLPKLQTLLEQSHRNGYKSIRLVSPEDVKVLEPNIRTEGGGALWSPATGIVDSHNFMLHLLGDAQEHGTCFAFQAEVEDAQLNKDDNNTMKLLVQGMWLSCQFVINCAGLWASDLATKFHNRHRQQQQPCCSSGSTTATSVSWLPPKQYFAKGM